MHEKFLWKGGILQKIILAGKMYYRNYCKFVEKIEVGGGRLKDGRVENLITLSFFSISAVFMKINSVCYTKI